MITQLGYYFLKPPLEAINYHLRHTGHPDLESQPPPTDKEFPPNCHSVSSVLQNTLNPIYNRQQIQKKLRHLSPVDFERQFYKLQKVA